MYADKMKQLEEDMFFGFVDDGVNDPDGVDREIGGWF
jgi:hypothetical protein